MNAEAASVLSGTTLPSYEESVQEHYTRILRYILNWTHNTQLAEDLTQETFMRAYRAWAKLRPDSTIDHWLTRVAASAIHAYFRKRSHREGWLSLEEIVEAEERRDILQARDEILEEACIERISLQAAFLQLPPHARETLRLLAEGLTYQQIADLQRSTIGAVASRVSRARTMLTKALSDKKPEAPVCATPKRGTC